MKCKEAGKLSLQATACLLLIWSEVFARAIDGVISGTARDNAGFSI